MAKCEAFNKTVSYRLELTEEEAQALLFVLGEICGTKDSPRKHTDAIWDALQVANVKEMNFKLEPGAGSLWFSDCA